MIPEANCDNGVLCASEAYTVLTVSDYLLPNFCIRFMVIHRLVLDPDGLVECLRVEKGKFDHSCFVWAMPKKQKSRFKGRKQENQRRG